MHPIRDKQLLGQYKAVVFISGDIDISVASILALCFFATGYASSAWAGTGSLVLIVAVLLPQLLEMFKARRNLKSQRSGIAK